MVQERSGETISFYWTDSLGSVVITIPSQFTSTLVAVNALLQKL